jgi:hypothetical protein
VYLVINRIESLRTKSVQNAIKFSAALGKSNDYSIEMREIIVLGKIRVEWMFFKLGGNCEDARENLLLAGCQPWMLHFRTTRKTWFTKLFDAEYPEYRQPRSLREVIHQESEMIIKEYEKHLEEEQIKHGGRLPTKEEVMKREEEEERNNPQPKPKYNKMGDRVYYFKDSDYM